MGERRLPGLSLTRAGLLVALLATALTALLAGAGVAKLGSAGLLVPLALVAVAIVLSRPVLAVTLVAGLAIVCEGSTFGLFTFTAHLYTNLYKNLSALDVLVMLAIASVALDLVRHNRAVWLPGPLRLPLAILVLATLMGFVTTVDSGLGIRVTIAYEQVLIYLILLPLAVANLDLDRSQLKRLLVGLFALAVVKSAVGLVEVAGHYGQSIEGASTLTYYEPTANWLIMLALLGSLALALLARAKPPLAVLLASPLLAACLLFSYRRSFWIAAVLALLLVVLLGTSPARRRLLLPTAIAAAAAIWLLGSVAFQAQLPIVKRAESLAPTKLETNVEDSYRLDERANVLAAIGEHPITGIGLNTPWAASTRLLSVEHEEGRLYVHFAALWYWLKLGILGLCAYLGVLLGGAVLAWQVWRTGHDLCVRAFGLASLAGIAGLAVIETTASFTGIEARFTVLFAAQLGLLALASRLAATGRDIR